MDTLDEKEKAAKEFEKQQREKQIVELFQRGFQDEGNIAGYHGTSLESLQFLIQNGYLPGYTRNVETHFRKKNDFFFAPVGEYFPKLKELDMPRKHALEMAQNYARQMSETYYVLQKLNLPFTDDTIFCMVQQALWDGNIEGIMQVSKEPKREVTKIIKDAKNRQGIVIALSKDLFTSDKLVRYGDDIGDLRIQLPNGLSLKDIVGIEPHGTNELKYLEKLQEKYS